MVRTPMLSSIFSSGCTAEISINESPDRRLTTFDPNTPNRKYPIFTNGESISGSAKLNVRAGKKLEHKGLIVELVGQLEIVGEKQATSAFFSMSKDLEGPGTLYESKAYEWRFPSVELLQETYWGSSFCIRYFARVIASRTYGSISDEAFFAVQNTDIPPEVNHSLKMEVGLEECLHIEFEYDKSKYDLNDVIVGKVYFLLVRLKIQFMEVHLVKIESAGSAPHPINESTIVTRFELMDGTPIRSECIPVRLFLSGLDLTPTYKSPVNKFSVKYYINLVLIDEDERRYFKKQEITLYRKNIGD